MFEQQIANGVAYLDEDLGKSWVERVNLEILELNDCLTCVIGQLYGNYYDRFDTVHVSTDEGIPYGFSAPGNEIGYHDYRSLTAEWKAKIEQLRKERGYVHA